jgi:hypothetical protein
MLPSVPHLHHVHARNRLEERIGAHCAPPAGDPRTPPVRPRTNPSRMGDASMAPVLLGHHADPDFPEDEDHGRESTNSQ